MLTRVAQRLLDLNHIFCLRLVEYFARKRGAVHAKAQFAVETAEVVPDQALESGQLLEFINGQPWRQRPEWNELTNPGVPVRIGSLAAKRRELCLAGLGEIAVGPEKEALDLGFVLAVLGVGAFPAHLVPVEIHQFVQDFLPVTREQRRADACGDDREHRQRGLARRLMQTMLDWCKQHQIANVVLHASDEGRPLYQSLGFVSTNEMCWQANKC